MAVDSNSGAGSSFAAFTPATPLVLVGCGRMGGALLNGWLDGGLDPATVLVIEPALEAHAELLARLPAAALVADVAALPAGIVPRALVLAVKPQVMDVALANLGPLAGPGTTVISIAAGKSLGFFKAALGAAVAVVRAMPNTPAAIGLGITAAVASVEVDQDGRELAAALLGAVGAFVWLDDEKHMDAVTALSGSGPAYVFYLTECLAAAGVAAGLPPELSLTLAVHTVGGAGALLLQSGTTPAALREAVTSPAGTTAAALDVLMEEQGLSLLMRRAVAAATKRSRELGS